MKRLAAGCGFLALVVLAVTRAPGTAPSGDRACLETTGGGAAASGCLLATVDGVGITLADYRKVRAFELVNQAAQNEQLAAVSLGAQQQQYLERAEQALADLERVWTSTAVDAGTLGRMIDDQLYQQHLVDLGLAVSDVDVRDHIAQLLAPPDASTPYAEPARQTAEAALHGYFAAEFLEPAQLSEDDYVRLIVRPAIARAKVAAALSAQVPHRAEQVHAAHVVVDTAAEAERVYREATAPGGSFEEVAEREWTRRGSAAGGDLGWFPRGYPWAVSAEVEAVAFCLAPGEVGRPVSDVAGWHVVKVYAREADRPLTEEQRSRLAARAEAAWLAARRGEAIIESIYPPAATPPPHTGQATSAACPGG